MSLKLGEIARTLGVELLGEADTLITGVGTLANAGSGQLSFLSNPSYHKYLQQTQASAVVLASEHAEACPTAALLSDNPYLTYARAAALLFPQAPVDPGIHASAVIDESACVDPGAQIAAAVVIGKGVTIAAGAYIGPGCVIEANCCIGEESRLVARVTLCQDTLIGKRCLIHPGAVLGADGFGLANDDGRWEKVPQLGRVRLGDDVEIGANTTVDRGALEDTILHDGVKLDNQIQIAHNVEIGEHTAMAGCSAVAGSTKIGSHCTVGGLAGIVGHLNIGDNVHFSAATLVSRSFEKAGYYSGGVPAMGNGEWRKMVARLRHLEEMHRDLKALKKKLEALEWASDK